MRKWLVQETGEVRYPRENESFLNSIGNIETAWFDFRASQYPILRVTEIPSPYEFDQFRLDGKDLTWWVDIKIVLDTYMIENAKELEDYFRRDWGVLPKEWCRIIKESDVSFDEWNW